TIGTLSARIGELDPSLNGEFRNHLSYLQHLVELQRPLKLDARPGTRAASATDPFAPIPGSFIAVTLMAPDGSPVAASRLDIDYVFGPGYETQNRKESRLVKPGNVAFRMPDAHYPVQAFL